jgi:inner membrane protein
MDNLCHTLTGAALGRAGLADRAPYGMATLMIAANLPDVDVAVFLTDTLPMSFRRGWTHGILAQVVLPVVLAAAVWLVARARARHDAEPRSRGALSGPAMPAPTVAGGESRRLFLTLLALCYVGNFSHVYLDYLNTYGLRILMPFSSRWVYGDALYVLDPWMHLMLGMGLLLSTRARRRRSPAWRPARAALLAAAVYTLAMLGANSWSRVVVRDGLVRAGLPADTRFMVTPVFANPIRREVVIDTGERYEKGVVWFEPAPRFRPSGYGVDVGFDRPEAQAVLASPRAQAYLAWSRFPFLVLDRSASPPRMFLNDYRYSDGTGRVGWALFAVEVGSGAE